MDIFATARTRMGEIKQERARDRATMAENDNELFKRAVVIILLWVIVDIKSADSSLFSLTTAIAIFNIYSLGFGPWHGADIYNIAIICMLFTSMCGYTALIAVLVGICVDQMFGVVEKHFPWMTDRKDHKGEAVVSATDAEASKE